MGCKRASPVLHTYLTMLQTRFKRASNVPHTCRERASIVLQCTVHTHWDLKLASTSNIVLESCCRWMSNMPQTCFKHTSSVPQTRVKFLLHFTRAANLLYRKADLPQTSSLGHLGHFWGTFASIKIIADPAPRIRLYLHKKIRKVVIRILYTQTFGTRRSSNVPQTCLKRTSNLPQACLKRAADVVPQACSERAVTFRRDILPWYPAVISYCDILPWHLPLTSCSDIPLRHPA